MKKTFLTSFFSIVTLCFVVAAQESSKQAEPEYDYVYHYLDPSSGALMALERQTPNARFQTKFGGFGGAKGTYEVTGGKSPVRFRSDQKIELIVRGIPSTTDPTTIVKLVRFDAKKDKREIVNSKVGAMGIGGATSNQIEGLPINTAKYGEHSLKIVPAESLPPGEYGVFSSNQVFCFGVDSTSKK